jgi:hypothetical protein
MLETGVDGVNDVRLVCKPQVLQSIRTSKSYIFGDKLSSLQAEQYRFPGAAQFGPLPLIPDPRMGGRYGNTLINGVKCPDMFALNASALFIYRRLDEAFHLIQAPSTWIGDAMLMKAYENFGFYAMPRTKEDYHAQVNQVLKSSNIMYFYILESPLNITVASLNTTAISNLAPLYTADGTAINGFTEFDINWDTTGTALGASVSKVNTLPIFVQNFAVLGNNGSAVTTANDARAIILNPNANKVRQGLVKIIMRNGADSVATSDTAHT